MRESFVNVEHTLEIHYNSRLLSTASFFSFASYSITCLSTVPLSPIAREKLGLGPAGPPRGCRVAHGP